MGRVCAFLLPATAALALALPTASAPAAQPATAPPARPGSAPTVIAVGTPIRIQPVARGFVGLSIEYWAVPDYAGTDATAINPVFLELVRNLADGSDPVLRIGGVTTDNSWWPAPGLSTPAGVTYALTPKWTAVMRAVAQAVQARLILGINLEADSPAVAGTEARALVDRIGRKWIEALEPGNEPELYGSFKWGISGAPGRPANYDFEDFEQDYARIAAALPNVPLAGPTDGAPSWFQLLGPFLSGEPRVAVATLHRYPLQQCFTPPDRPNYPTIPNLLSPTSSRTMANTVAAAVKVAHAHRVAVRIDEMNTISCGNVPAVGNSFASALWSLDALFAMARVGVDGVNIHTFPGDGTQLFTFRRAHGQWRGTPAPEYYGLEMFAQAAPPGSRLLGTSFSHGGAYGLRSWATQSQDGTLRIVLINDASRSRAIDLDVPGAAALATIERLDAPSVSARRGVTLGGQSYAPATGRLAGPSRTSAVAPSPGGDYAVSVPAGSAALLTIASP